ncbi:alpha-ketoglutarate decarboxylase [Oceanihabitans sp. 2_MG-2023]|uniref:alpha-ketoglutarate decarboxylase n=1 Tax=Oceanihabitans sp. 2_MG-2023 TaxID=3062661 RepID=UPI0026E333B5|nr:alpha-ketoglutarate decarboxylase [Oceanihabitans sp. 2_MG-2023]MDO6596467.1 alpha-ketoglutarate decarboxylase [Oceanihabitans sp. 2_MG-2023]
MNISAPFTKKIIAFLVFSCFVNISAKAQENNVKQKSAFWQKVRVGGGIGLGFGDGFFSGTLAPSAIYQFDDQFALGITLNTTYNKRKNAYKSTILGGGIIGLYNPIPEIQLSGEFEQLHVNRDFDSSYVSNLDETYWSPALFLGAGYRSQNFTIGIRYDVLYDDDKSVYGSAWIPFVRVYF